MAYAIDNPAADSFSTQNSYGMHYNVYIQLIERRSRASFVHTFVLFQILHILPIVSVFSLTIDCKLDAALQNAANESSLHKKARANKKTKHKT